MEVGGDVSLITAHSGLEQTKIVQKGPMFLRFFYTVYGVGEEPSFSLSEKIDLADRFPGLPCNIDAAFSMYGRNFFFKGCLYYELVPKTIFNETSGIESLGGEITKAQDIYDWGLQINTEYLVYISFCYFFRIS